MRAARLRARILAALMLLLVVLFLVELRALTGAAPYLTPVAVGVVALALVCVPWLTFTARVEARALAFAPTAVAFVGELLNRSVGLPGAASLGASFGVAERVGLLLEVAALGILAVDAVLNTTNTRVSALNMCACQPLSWSSRTTTGSPSRWCARWSVRGTT